MFPYPSNDPFRVLVDRDIAGATVTISGELDAANAPHLRPILLDLASDASSETVTLDIRDVTFLDSSGLGLFMTAALTVRKREGVFRIVNSTAAAQRIFQISGFDRTAHVVVSAGA